MYFSNPDVIFELPLLGDGGFVLHAWTTAHLDCMHPQFEESRRRAIEREAISLSDGLFDRVIVHQL